MIKYTDLSNPYIKMGTIVGESYGVTIGISSTNSSYHGYVTSVSSVVDVKDGHDYVGSVYLDFLPKQILYDEYKYVSDDYMYSFTLAGGKALPSGSNFAVQFYYYIENAPDPRYSDPDNPALGFIMCATKSEEGGGSGFTSRGAENVNFSHYGNITTVSFDLFPIPLEDFNPDEDNSYIYIQGREDSLTVKLGDSDVAKSDITQGGLIIGTHYTYNIYGREYDSETHLYTTVMGCGLITTTISILGENKATPYDSTFYEYIMFEFYVNDYGIHDQMRSADFTEYCYTMQSLIGILIETADCGQGDMITAEKLNRPLDVYTASGRTLPFSKISNIVFSGTRKTGYRTLTEILQPMESILNNLIMERAST